MRQKSIGEVLRSARETRGLNFVELQRMTKIQAKYLQALEYNDFDYIPDPSYTRSFLKRYAEVLDLDAEVLLDAYQTNSLVIYYEAGEELEKASELKRGYKVRQNKSSVLPLFYLLVAAVSILIFVTYIVLNRVQNQAIQSQTPSLYKVVSSSSVVSTETVSESSTTPSSTSPSSNVQLNTSGSGAQLSVTLSGTTGAVEVQLSVTEATSWISLTNTELANGFTLSPQSKSVTTLIPEEVKETTLVLGVVKGVTIQIAGQTLDMSSLTEPSATIQITIE